ncbi:hypothetical protein RUM43_012566, partial [Polyplax serrata]
MYGDTPDGKKRKSEGVIPNYLAITQKTLCYMRMLLRKKMVQQTIRRKQVQSRVLKSPLR